ncbi:MAG: nitrilase-related carbon-nitrogen hydrolase [Candidatus Celaenobacter antarcticus]|nr:nitrilase-related carbon-nitrogen hydrolase [Candidatus Celaenobacter antarcticus]
MTKIKKNYSYAYLLIGFVFLFFSNGRWTLPLATFIAPIFLIRFLRFHKPLKGFIFLIFAGFISNIFIWKEQIPVPGFVYYIMCFMMSLFTALVFLTDRVYSQRLKGIVSTLILPSAFVLMDYISVLTNPGGTFGALATTQSSLPLLQLLSITGIWGITFIILWTASIINWLWDNNFNNNAFHNALWKYVLPVIIIILCGQIRLSQNFTDNTVKIASVNIPKMGIQHIFNDKPDSVNEQINSSFLNNCEIAAGSEAKIVFGNEIMLNMSSDKEDAYLEKAKAVAVRNNIYIGLPLLIYPIENPGARPMNKITWISPQGEILFTYFKAKPTPGEGSYGDGVIKYFDSPYGRISSVICFDMDFPKLIQQVNSMNIDIMLVPGNDWKEITPYHTYAASFKAIEQGFNLVRSASRGLSASFNYKGQVLSSQNYFTSKDTLFYSDVPMNGKRTIYAVIGDSFAWLCIIFFIIISVIFIKQK